MHFDIAIVLFALVNVLMGTPNKLKTFLWALIGWKAIGNSNWFIFCTLALYLLTIPAFFLLRRHRKAAICAMWCLTLGFILYLRSIEKDSWWYNTLLCYPLGMLWSEIRGFLEERFRRNIIYWWCAAVSSLSVFAFCLALYMRRKNGHHYPGILRSMDPQWFYLFFACMFCLVVVITQMRLRTHNPVLHWLGVHSFGIYILQRLPMRILQHLELDKRTELFIILSAAATLMIAPIFTWATGKLDGLIFADRPQKGKQPIVHHNKRKNKSGKRK